MGRAGRDGVGKFSFGDNLSFFLTFLLHQTLISTYKKTRCCRSRYLSSLSGDMGQVEQKEKGKGRTLSGRTEKGQSPKKKVTTTTNKVQHVQARSHLSHSSPSVEVLGWHRASCKLGSKGYGKRELRVELVIRKPVIMGNAGVILVKGGSGGCLQIVKFNRACSLGSSYRLHLSSDICHDACLYSRISSLVLCVQVGMQASMDAYGREARLDSMAN